MSLTRVATAVSLATSWSGWNSFTLMSLPAKGARTVRLLASSSRADISLFRLSTWVWAWVTWSWASWLKMVYRGCPAVTVSPGETKTSCTVPPAERVMAADSLALALPLPVTLLWMVPYWTGWVWISLLALSCLVRKR